MLYSEHLRWIPEKTLSMMHSKYQAGQVLRGDGGEMVEVKHRANADMECPDHGIVPVYWTEVGGHCHVSCFLGECALNTMKLVRGSRQAPSVEV